LSRDLSETASRFPDCVLARMPRPASLFAQACRGVGGHRNFPYLPGFADFSKQFPHGG